MILWKICFLMSIVAKASKILSRGAWSLLSSYSPCTPYFPVTYFLVIYNSQYSKIVLQFYFLLFKKYFTWGSITSFISFISSLQSLPSVLICTSSIYTHSLLISCFTLIVFVTCVCVCKIHVSYSVHFYYLCMYGLKVDHSVRDNNDRDYTWDTIFLLHLAVNNC